MFVIFSQYGQWRGAAFYFQNLDISRQPYYEIVYRQDRGETKNKQTKQVKTTVQLHVRGKVIFIIVELKIIHSKMLYRFSVF